jgi:predicted nuclease with TOPRIM domain
MDKVPEDLDLFGFTAPSSNQLQNISMWAQEALRLNAEIEMVEEHLKGLKSELADIEERKLPDALLKARMSEFTMEDGSEISVKDVIQGGFPKDVEKRERIFAWVIKEGGQETIKDHFEVHYTKGQYSDAVAFRKLLQERKIIFDEFENIHTQTLYAFLRAKIDERIMPPFDEFGLRYFKKAYIKQAK